MVEVGSGDYSFVLQCGCRTVNNEAPVGKFGCDVYDFDSDERFAIGDAEALLDRVS